MQMKLDAQKENKDEVVVITELEEKLEEKDKEMKEKDEESNAIIKMLEYSIEELDN